MPDGHAYAVYRPFNLLLVEDNPDDVWAIQRALEQGDFNNKVWVAGDGLEALDLLRSPDGPHGRLLVLLDLHLPRMSGVETLQAMRADPALAPTPVVVLTTSTDDRERLEAYKLNVAGYLRKPVRSAAFIEVMSAVEHYWAMQEFP